MEDSLLTTLEKYWGYKTFRPLQQEIIQAILKGQDVLALLPTGAGKSMCFQLPALIRPGLCLVVSPLIALIKDQVDRLRKQGVVTEAIFSGMSAYQIDLVLDRCIYGKVKFLYVSPERLQTTILQERATQMAINSLVVDEAHCISQWGYNFRPAYLKISEFKQVLNRVNTIALTATATPTVQRDIQAKLKMHHPVRFQGCFVRKNLTYIVRKTENKSKRLINILQQTPGAAIVYVNSRRQTSTLTTMLQRVGIHARAYHAGLTSTTRTMHQGEWLRGATRVMVATNAFGMGIDKPDVRVVVHFELPSTLEAYYQEAGRAGRDEQNAYAVLLYDDQDILALQSCINFMHPSATHLKQVYQHLANYYQVAVGSHNMVTYDFDLIHFAQTYTLQPRLAYQALKILTQEGLIQLDETATQPAQLHIHVDYKALYNFRVAHITYDHLLSVLLRLYGGELFTLFHNISIQSIAQLLDTSVQKVDQKLRDLERLNIVKYHPQNVMPQLTFTTARYPAQALPLSHKRLHHQRKIAQEKIKAVIHYVNQQRHCRMKWILEYLNEVDYPECGKCDVCSKKEENKHAKQYYLACKSRLSTQLQKGNYSPEEIMDHTPFTQQNATLAVIRHMLDKRELTYDTFGKLQIV